MDVVIAAASYLWTACLLQDILMALSFNQASKSWVPAKPWQHGVPSKCVAVKELLSDKVQGHLERLLELTKQEQEIADVK